MAELSQALAKVATLKTGGNAKFKAGDMAGAVKGYTAAIEALLPLTHGDDVDASVNSAASVLYANRSAANLAMEKDEGARRSMAMMLGAMPEMQQIMWEGEVLNALGKAEQDAITAVTFDKENPKAHFRAGLAALALSEKDSKCDRLELLKRAAFALEESHRLKPLPATKTKMDMTKMLVSQEMAKKAQAAAE